MNTCVLQFKGLLMNKFKIITILLVIFSLILTSCFSDRPKTTIEKMREAACAGNVEEFFSYVDKTKAHEEFKKDLVRNYDQYKEEPTSFWQSIAEFILIKLYEFDFYSLTEEHAKVIDKAENLLTDVMWSSLEEDVKKGTSGNICSMEISRKQTEKDQLKTLFKSGQEEIWTFNKESGNWKLVFVTLVDSTNE